MTEFINAWKNYANFTDRTTVRGYWMAWLFFIIAAFIVGVIAAIANTLVISYIWSAIIFIPSLSIGIRRLRDAGKPWTYIFINLIPCAGIVLYIIALTKPSIPDNGVPQV